MMKSYSLLFIFCFAFAADFEDTSDNSNLQPKKKKTEKSEDLNRKKRSYWKKSNLLFHRFMRSSEYSATNPSFLGIKKPHYNGRFDLVPFGFHFTNETLSPNFLFDYFSKGQTLSQNEKSDIRSALDNFHLLTQISANPIVFEYGPVGFDVKLNTTINGKINGNLLSLPFQDFVVGSTLKQNMDIEIFSYHQSGLKYGHKFKTDAATFRAGLGFNFYQGHTFFKAAVDTIKIVNSEDSVAVDVSYYFEGSQMIWDILDENDSLDVMETFSNSTQGFDIGFGVNLKKIIKQNVDVEIGLLNIGTTLKFEKAKKERYSYSLSGSSLQEIGEITSDSDQDFDTTLVYENKALEVKIPTVWFLQVTYQPMPQFLFSVALEQGAEKRFYTEETPRLTFRTGYYPLNWLNLNYALKTIHGQLMQNIGIGFQFSVLDFLFNVSSYDGWKYNANGMGLNLRTSIYF